MAMHNFDESFPFGQMGESLIAQWLRKRGWAILPVYEKEEGRYEGPRLFLPYGCPEERLIAPDMQAMRDKQIRWIEAKHKNTASYYRIKQRWQTGIDKRCYLDYLKVQAVTKWPVWLLFLQRLSTVTNAPPDMIVKPCPTGLFGCSITQPFSDSGYYTRNGRRYEMVYWGIEELKPIATLEDVLGLSERGDA